MRIGIFAGLGQGSSVGFDVDDYVLTEDGLWLKGDAGKTIPSAPDISPHTPLNTASWGNFAQAVAGQRPHDSTAGGEGSALYDGTGGFGAGDHLINSLSAATWNGFHQTGFSFMLTLRLNAGGGGTIFDNIGTNANGYGTYLQANNGTKNITWRVADGSGTFAVSSVHAAAYADGDTLILDGAWSPEFGFYFSKNGGPALTGRYIGTVPVNDASNALYIGAGAPGSFGFGWFDWLDGLFVEGIPSVAVRSSLLNHFANKHSVSLGTVYPAGYVESTEDLFAA